MNGLSTVLRFDPIRRVRGKKEVIANNMLRVRIFDGDNRTVDCSDLIRHYRFDHLLKVIDVGNILNFKLRYIPHFSSVTLTFTTML
jgi:hypothetical protein